jgi:hypothetical protein
MLSTDLKKGMIEDVMQKVLEATTIIMDNDENVVDASEARAKYTRVPLADFVLKAGAKAE